MASVAGEYSEMHIDVKTDSPKKEESPTSKLMRKISSGVLNLKKKAKVPHLHSKENEEEKVAESSASTPVKKGSNRHGRL